jgi:hypothetical protein
MTLLLLLLYTQDPPVLNTKPSRAPSKEDERSKSGSSGFLSAVAGEGSAAASEASVEAALGCSAFCICLKRSRKLPSFANGGGAAAMLGNQQEAKADTVIALTIREIRNCTVHAFANTLKEGNVFHGASRT